MRFPTKFIEDMSAQDKRMDGRKADEFRKITIEKNPVEKACGSALVSIGDTKVLAGVKMDVGEPFSDTPDEGVLMVSGELSPGADPEFETGPPKEGAIELARVVDRGIRESKTMDVNKLCVKKGEKVWMVYIDFTIINNDGNLIDACSLASVAALHLATFPPYDEKEDKVSYMEKTNKKLPVNYKPIAVTFHKVGGKLIADANKEEEAASTARLTVTTKDDGNLCALQKGDAGTFKIEEIEHAFDTSVRMGKELRKLV